MYLQLPPPKFECRICITTQCLQFKTATASKRDVEDVKQCLGYDRAKFDLINDALRKRYKPKTLVDAVII